MTNQTIRIEGIKGAVTQGVIEAISDKLSVQKLETIPENAELIGMPALERFMILNGHATDKTYERWAHFRNQVEEDEEEEEESDDKSSASVNIYSPITSESTRQIYKEFFGVDTVSGSSVSEELYAAADKSDTILVNLNSPGGVVREAAVIISVMDELVEDGKTINTFVRGIAASAASVIAVLGEKVTISRLGEIMVHSPLVGVQGNARVLRKMAQNLDDFEKEAVKIYDERANYEKANVKDGFELLKGEDNDGTYLTASQSLEIGFVDEIQSGPKRRRRNTAKASMSNYNDDMELERDRALASIFAIETETKERDNVR